MPTYQSPPPFIQCFVSTAKKFPSFGKSRIKRTACTSALVNPRPSTQVSHAPGGYLALMVVFHLPASRQLQLLVGKHVEEAHQVPIVLVALKMVGVPPDFGDHVLQTRVVCKHAVGTLRNKQQKEILSKDEMSSYYKRQHFHC